MSRNTASNEPAVSDETNQQILTYGMAIFAAVAVLRLIFSSFTIILLPVFGIMYLTCPTDESFDAKKELKRVYRGQHLPEDDPNKPKSWLEKAAAKVAATVVAETTTALGYTLTFIHASGFFTVAKVKLDAAELEYYWIGCLNKWSFAMSRDLTQT